MRVESTVDPDQTDNGNHRNMAFCPVCGQKLFRVESIFHRGVFRHKCRRCKKYIRVKIQDTAG